MPNSSQEKSKETDVFKDREKRKDTQTSVHVQPNILATRFSFVFSMYADDARTPGVSVTAKYKVRSLKSVVRMATNEQRERVRKNTRLVGRRRRRRRKSSLVVAERGLVPL